MGGLTRTQGDDTLQTLWGFPYGAWRKMPWADTAFSAAVSVSFVFALVGLGAALIGETVGYFVSDGVGSRISFVSPAGFVWSDGVRPGDLILSLGESGEPGGWVMTVQQPSGATVRTAQEPRDLSLRATTPIAVLALLSGLASLVLRVRWPKGAWAAASISATLTCTPFIVQGDPQVSTLGLSLATLIPATALLEIRNRSPVAIVAYVAFAMFLVAWAFGRIIAIGDPTSLEALRSTIAFYLTLGVIAVAAIDLRRRQAVDHRHGGSTYDLVGAAAFIGTLVVMALFLHVDWVILAVITLAVVLAYPRSRRAVLRTLDLQVLGDIRRQAAIKASEGERARLAADLHDIPIQELSSVIARLELLDLVADEREALRRIAWQLRALTTELRPPVLDDLGLPLAMEALADQFPSGPTISVDVVDRMQSDSRRDPEVDLAIYRITEEAVRNAVAHSSARHIHLSGLIAPDAIEIEVRDDGRGLDQRALEHAYGTGHAGLLAMRCRAESVGARFSLRSELGAGASVTVVWRR